ncbi:hypothetical protein ACFSVM_04210 [Paenibacillus shunpengii]|uniref:Uncharacterized protein n=1 Tax=Paenibacillus shunpengii TaxID=2054424 RepID=A0ABW5SIY2_9BACL|nr:MULTISPECIES: hypothetical protein [unclassified Paenibacillus]OMC71685.1 hypothetical protein BK126_06350 [Paenibacillus sp. FSL H7-0326]SDW34626.1 hypothetical protein SAMN05518848_1011090 [Paenibacillus sp. PDC88]
MVIILIILFITLLVALSNRSRLKDMEADMEAIKRKLNIADKDTPPSDEEIEAELQKMHEEDQK